MITIERVTMENNTLRVILQNKGIDNYIDLKKFLVNNHNIQIFENDTFIILTRNINSDNLTKLEYNSYFTILSKEQFRILYTMYDYVYLNNDSINLLCRYKLLNYNFNIYESFDGIELVVFYYKDSWNFITKNSLNNTLNRNLVSNLLNIDNLLELLNPNIVYVFVILDSKFDILVNYSNRFGNEYGLLYHVSSQLDNVYLDLSNRPLESCGIKYRKLLKDYSLLDHSFDTLKSPIFKGLEIDVYFEKNYYKFILDSDNYKYANKLKPEKNKYKSYLKLYQNNLLINHIQKYSNNKFIINTKIPNDKYETYEVVDRSVKLLSYELFELFKLVWNIADTSHRDSQLYNFLPTEYKVLLYRIKGIYFQNRQDNNLSHNNEYLEVMNIFEYLKTVENELLLKLFISRRKIKYILEKKNTLSSINKSFKNISSKIDKLSLKVIAIFTNYLHPEIKKVEV